MIIGYWDDCFATDAGDHGNTIGSLSPDKQTNPDCLCRERSDCRVGFLLSLYACSIIVVLKKRWFLSVFHLPFARHAYRITDLLKGISSYIRLCMLSSSYPNVKKEIVDGVS